VTDAERMACIEAWSLGSWGDRLGEVVRICIAIEKLVGEPAPDAQPIGWLTLAAMRALNSGGSLKGTAPVHCKKSPASKIPLYARPLALSWPWPIRGVRVEDATVIIKVKGGNDAARWLCGEVLAVHGEKK